MSASTFDRDRADLEEAIRAQRLATRTAAERIDRLLRTAFRDEQAPERFRNQVAERGESRALAMAQGRDDLPRALWIGRLRGGFFNREDRIQAEVALAELPAALADASRQQDQLRDLEQTRDRLVLERDRHRTRVQVDEQQRRREPAQERGIIRSLFRSRR